MDFLVFFLSFIKNFEFFLKILGELFGFLCNNLIDVFALSFCYFREVKVFFQLIKRFNKFVVRTG